MSPSRRLTTLSCYASVINFLVALPSMQKRNIHQHLKSTCTKANTYLKTSSRDKSTVDTNKHISKRSKILKVLERMDPAYDRGFLACLVETEVQSSYTRGFTIALSMPKRPPPK